MCMKLIASLTFLNGFVLFAGSDFFQNGFVLLMGPDFFLIGTSRSKTRGDSCKFLVISALPLFLNKISFGMVSQNKVVYLQNQK